MDYYKKDVVEITIKYDDFDKVKEEYEQKGYVHYGTIYAVDDYVNLTFYKYINVEDLNEDKQTEEDKMIRATNKANITKQDLLDTFTEKGLVGVYNLGLKNMLDYLNGR